MLVLVFVLLFMFWIAGQAGNDGLERSGDGDVRSGVGRDCAAYSARADVAGTVAAVACGNAKVSHREAQSGVVVVQACAAVVPHIAGEHAPVRCEVHLKKPCHPVLLVVLAGQILELQTGRKG